MTTPSSDASASPQLYGERHSNLKAYGSLAVRTAPMVSAGASMRPSAMIEMERARERS